MTQTTITSTTSSVTPINPYSNAQNLSTHTNEDKTLFDRYILYSTASTFDELEPALKDRNLAALNDTTPVIHSPLQKKEEYLCFSETTSFEFANAYPCTIEFEGRWYSNATACFLAQQYTDQPNVMDLLAKCETALEADQLAKQHVMTPERKKFWGKFDTESEMPSISPMFSIYLAFPDLASISRNIHCLLYCDLGCCHMEIPIDKNEAMMRVLRAKFEQNPELKEMLLATGDFYLVCQGNDPYWSDSFDSTGENKLAIFLMCLREEYGGTGIVLPRTDYNNMVLELKDRSYSILSNLHEDITRELFMHCLSGDNGKDIFCFGNTNKHFYNQMTSFVKKTDLTLLCPNLTIFDAITLGHPIDGEGHPIDGEPSINKFALVKSYYDLAPNVENNEGLTLLTMHKDCRFRETVSYAAKAGIAIQFSDNELEENLSQYTQTACRCCTYRVLITNNVFLNSRNKHGLTQFRLLEKMGCKEPNLLEYTHLCIYQKIFNNKCLYTQGTLARSRSSMPPKYNESSDCVVIGNFSPTGPLCVSIDPKWPSPNLGMGGMRIIRSESCDNNKSLCTIS